MFAVKITKSYSAVADELVGINLSEITFATKIPTTIAPAVHNIPLMFAFILLTINDLYYVYFVESLSKAKLQGQIYIPRSLRCI